jgi:hypothetical protein
MTTLFGILGAAALFVLFGYAATRHGARLGGGGSCHGDSCTVEGGCEGCGVEAEDSTGWWPDGE